MATTHPGASSMRLPRVGVYAGQGSSHSWLWFVELFDRAGLHDLSFLDEESLGAGGLEGLDVLAVSGGDTFAMAEALGQAGAECLRSFVHDGGIYIGSCAGAYLPMKSSKEPLNLFNFVDVKITNLAKILPRAQRMPHKFCTAYGCDFIFHPVREAVRLSACRTRPLEAPSFEAPLYGGPGMVAFKGAEVLATYEGFTRKTLFLVDRSLAEETLLGKGAAVRALMGKGWFYLLGPHFEHPHFPEANRFITATILRHAEDIPARNSRSDPCGCELADARGFVLDLKRELSNSRIAARSMEMLPIRWLIGSKVYEPEKIGVFLEAMWKRVGTLGGGGRIAAPTGDAERLLACARKTTRLLRRLKQRLNEGDDAPGAAKEVFQVLQRLSMLFFETYFQNVSRGAPSLSPKRRTFRTSSHGGELVQ